MIPVKYDRQRYRNAHEGEGPQWDNDDEDDDENNDEWTEENVIGAINEYLDNVINQIELLPGFAGIKVYDSVFSQISNLESWLEITERFERLDLDNKDIRDQTVVIAKLDIFVEHGEIQYDLQILVDISAPSEERQWHTLEHAPSRQRQGHTLEHNTLIQLQQVRNIVFEQKVNIERNFYRCNMVDIIFKDEAICGHASFFNNHFLKSVNFNDQADLAPFTFRSCIALELVIMMGEFIIRQDSRQNPPQHAFMSCPSLRYIFVTNANVDRLNRQLQDLIPGASFVLLPNFPSTNTVAFTLRL